MVICNICDPLTGEDYTRDPRNIARKAEAFLKGTGLADIAYFGPECEFFIFDDIRYDQNEHEGYYHIDSAEGRWNTGRQENPNLGYKIRYKEGYFPVPPNDTLQDIRSEMMLTLESIDVPIEAQHHEVATGGQCEIDMRFNNLLTMADNVLKYKYVVKNTAKKHGKVATFMPKPLFGDNGSGMHVHFSLWKGGKNLFAGDGYAGLSPDGPARHRRAARSTPRRSSPSPRRRPTASSGWCPASRRRSTSPTRAATAARRSASRCTPPSPKAKRLEFRCPDPSSNPYLTFSAMLMAAVDGIQNKIDPGKPLDKDIYDLPPEELAAVPKAPGLAPRGAEGPARTTTSTC